MVATVAAGTVQLGVKAWMFTYIPEACVRARCDTFLEVYLPGDAGVSYVPRSVGGGGLLAVTASVV